MKFYNRESELAILSKADMLKSKQSVMTMLIGRRRIGKTTLALHSYTKDKVLYLFVSKKVEALLCQDFCEEIVNKLGIKIFGELTRFEDIFEYLLELGKTQSFTIVIDEFQEFLRINPSIYSSMQKLWDLNKNTSKIHLITCGSIYHLMKKIYEDSSEPLFGRCDFKIELKPFSPSVLKEILQDNQSYTTDNMLDFYSLTGGVAKYIELFSLYNSFELRSMIDVIIEPNSIFLSEGKNRLIEEFGKDYGTYFSILSLIAESKTSRPEIESILQSNISGHLHRLEHDYSIIRSIKPINAKPNSKVQKYEIVDIFLAFWFRFIFKYQSLVEAENFLKLKEIIYRDISIFKGKVLERLFVEIFKDTQIYTKIGSYWERGNKNEIDIVAIDDIDRKILICEVKLNENKLALNKLILKSQKLVNQYNDYKIDYQLLSLKDIDNFLLYL
ncbi:MULTISPECIES: ATP-binding protein [Francisella]|uniref:ATPase n=1 Tax=Francisella opportunistica TaxID=2016517 RepID=A0A345JQ26_9GAMM|nr:MULTISPECIES: ATP-binding protein [Francisella]AXH29422.1 ATPase [Francisella opportunistica]AXH31074.1 ATPase [Francisella opportunistica]AXH32719.1 ATPase [Francisella opportunistica]